MFTVTQDDPEIPFTETDFRRRRTHPNFKEHIAAEKLVTKLGKTVKTRSDNGSIIWVTWDVKTWLVKRVTLSVLVLMLQLHCCFIQS